MDESTSCTTSHFPPDDPQIGPNSWNRDLRFETARDARLTSGIRARTRCAHRFRVRVISNHRFASRATTIQDDWPKQIGTVTTKIDALNPAPPLLHFARVSTICPATNGKSVYYMMRIRLIWSFYIGVGNKNERINSAYYIPVIFYCYLEVNILFWRKRRKKRESLADLSKLWKLWWTVFLLRFDKPHATRRGGGGGGVGGWVETINREK